MINALLRCLLFSALLGLIATVSGLRAASQPDPSPQGRRGAGTTRTPAASPQGKPAATAKPAASADAQRKAGSGIVSSDVLSRIPRNVTDMVGHPNDPVNILVLGSETDLRLAFETAQWQPVDRSTKSDDDLRKAADALSDQAFLGAPLSQRFLFGHAQDISFSHDDLVAGIRTRHIVRLWRAPFAAGAKVMWVGSAAHDVPWWDDATSSVSNQMDPNVDDERNFVGDTLGATGLIARSALLGPAGGTPAQSPAAALPDPQPDPKTPAPASAAYHTDGRILALAVLSLPSN